MWQVHAKLSALTWGRAFVLLATLFSLSCKDSSDSAGPVQACTPLAVECQGDAVVSCLADGSAWSAPSPCDQGLQCNGGACQPAGVEILTTTLPDGNVGAAYDVGLEVNQQGCSWTLELGALPDGMALSTDGHVAGTPTVAGDFDLTAKADCGAAGTADALYVLTIHAVGFAITTASLPAALDGFDYSFQLAATGGSSPYGWMVADGALPAGVYLTADGQLLGAPSEVGDFPLTFKAFDNADSPQVASKSLTLTVNIAPLEVIGTTQYDLLITKVIILDTIAIVPGFPFPYSTQLQARGGLKPYTWSEIPLPSALTFLIPQSGIPTGLTLDADGTLHGAVTTTDQVITVTVPLSTVTITGFFFAGQVADSQSPQSTKTAIFAIPTIPIGG